MYQKLYSSWVFSLVPRSTPTFTYLNDFSKISNPTNLRLIISMLKHLLLSDIIYRCRNAKIKLKCTLYWASESMNYQSINHTRHCDSSDFYDLRNNISSFKSSDTQDSAQKSTSHVMSQSGQMSSFYKLTS